MKHRVAAALIISFLLAALVGVSQSFPASGAGSVPPRAEIAHTPTHPHDVDELSPATRSDGGPEFLILRNDGYVAAYDEARKNPAWVCYTFAGKISWTGHKHENGFHTDKRTRAHVRSADYTNSGFDRGHMAPSFGIFSFCGEAAKDQTYLYSNVVPQLHALNDGPWGDVEELEAKTWTEHSGKIRVFSGPAYRDPVTTIGRGIAVPYATWKIVVRATSDGRFDALAFLMPQTAAQRDRPEKYLTSIRTIEAATHLDFFAVLPDDEENALETTVATDLWK